jgi:hypothetical protein
VSRSRAKPRHDWASHGADAFRILAQCWREPPKEYVKPQPKPTEPTYQFQPGGRVTCDMSVLDIVMAKMKGRSDYYRG